jgi:1-acyl-sn-glycerol-3-phosphate acyltransferase
MGRYAKKIRVFPRTTIDVIIGPPLDLSRFEGKPLTREILSKATEMLMKEIATLVGQLRDEKPPVKRFDPSKAA